MIGGDLKKSLICGLTMALGLVDIGPIISNIGRIGLRANNEERCHGDYLAGLLALILLVEVTMSLLHPFCQEMQNRLWFERIRATEGRKQDFTQPVCAKTAQAHVWYGLSIFA